MVFLITNKMIIIKFSRKLKIFLIFKKNYEINIIKFNNVSNIILLPKI